LNLTSPKEAQKDFINIKDDETIISFDDFELQEGEFIIDHNPASSIPEFDFGPTPQDLEDMKKLENVEYEDKLNEINESSIPAEMQSFEFDDHDFNFNFDEKIDSPIPFTTNFVLNQEEFDSEEMALANLFNPVSALCGDPDYSKQCILYPNTNVNDVDFKKGYSTLRVKFKFPKSVIYPPIPVQLDKNITIYPSEGEALITGLEFITAKNILKQALALDNTAKGYVKIITGNFIPFNTKENAISPFFNVINELQANRRAHPKKSAMERIYKDLGNMLYGKVVCGISNKRSFDSRLLQMKAMTGNYLANPIIGG
jgi:hypothetical protein